ncbi:MAG: hypothetical protein ACO1OF_03465 [Adhaeribacter sp.]
MRLGKPPHTVKMQYTVAWYNAIPNVLWSVLNLLPVSVFCYRFLPLKLLLVFLGISFLTVLLPKGFFYNIQLSQTTAVYKKIGVGFINKFTQNGAIINKLIRKRYPAYKVVSGSKRSVAKVLGQTFMFEKFHFLLFVFFSFIMVYALVKGYLGWALVLFITNILYNIYPCLLQQYIRVRLSSAIKRE